MIDAPRDHGPEGGAVFRRATEPMTSSGGDGASLAPVLAPLVDALVGAGQQHLDSMTRLRTTICAYVEALLRQGFSSPEIVSTVRAIVGDLRAAGSMRQPGATGSDTMLEQVVAWCVEYGAPEPQDS